jgi:hypothetical protein
MQGGIRVGNAGDKQVEPNYAKFGDTRWSACNRHKIARFLITQHEMPHPASQTLRQDIITTYGRPTAAQKIDSF